MGTAVGIGVLSVAIGIHSYFDVHIRTVSVGFGVLEHRMFVGVQSVVLQCEGG